MIALFGVLAFGIVGYLFLGFSPLDAVYMTVMTVSTVGFGEVEPLSPPSDSCRLRLNV